MRSYVDSASLKANFPSPSLSSLYLPLLSVSRLKKQQQKKNKQNLAELNQRFGQAAARLT